MSTDNYLIESYAITFKTRKFTQIYYYAASALECIEDYLAEDKIKLKDVDDYVDITLNLVEDVAYNSASTEEADYAEKTITYEDLKENNF